MEYPNDWYVVVCDAGTDQERELKGFAYYTDAQKYLERNDDGTFDILKVWNGQRTTEY